MALRHAMAPFLKYFLKTNVSARHTQGGPLAEAPCHGAFFPNCLKIVSTSLQDSIEGSVAYDAPFSPPIPPFAPRRLAEAPPPSAIS